MSRYSRRVACVRQMEDAVAGLVEEGFAALLELPSEIREIADPWIGVIFDPHEPKQAVGLRNIVIRAMAARCWAQLQQPDLPPLPLRVEDIKEMKADPDPVIALWGSYGEHFRDYSWDVRRWWVTFDRFCDFMQRAEASRSGRS
jgi:hypothetical protein